MNCPSWSFYALSCRGVAQCKLLNTALHSSLSACVRLCACQSPVCWRSAHVQQQTRGYVLCRFSALIDNGILLKLVSMRLNSITLPDRSATRLMMACFSVIPSHRARPPSRAYGMRLRVFCMQRVEESCGKIKESDADAILGIFKDLKTLKEAA